MRCAVLLCVALSWPLPGARVMGDVRLKCQDADSELHALAADEDIHFLDVSVPPGKDSHLHTAFNVMWGSKRRVFRPEDKAQQRIDSCLFSLKDGAVKPDCVTELLKESSYEYRAVSAVSAGGDVAIGLYCTDIHCFEKDVLAEVRVRSPTGVNGTYAVAGPEGHYTVLKIVTASENARLHPVGESVQLVALRGPRAGSFLLTADLGTNGFVQKAPYTKGVVMSAVGVTNSTMAGCWFRAPLHRVVALQDGGWLDAHLEEVQQAGDSWPVGTFVHSSLRGDNCLARRFIGHTRYNSLQSFTLADGSAAMSWIHDFGDGFELQYYDTVGVPSGSTVLLKPRLATSLLPRQVEAVEAEGQHFWLSVWQPEEQRSDVVQRNVRAPGLLHAQLHTADGAAVGDLVPLTVRGTNTGLLRTARTDGELWLVYTQEMQVGRQATVRVRKCTVSAPLATPSPTSTPVPTVPSSPAPADGFLEEGSQEVPQASFAPAYLAVDVVVRLLCLTSLVIAVHRRRRLLRETLAQLREAGAAGTAASMTGVPDHDDGTHTQGEGTGHEALLADGASTHNPLLDADLTAGRALATPASLSHSFAAQRGAESGGDIPQCL